MMEKRSKYFLFRWMLAPLIGLMACIPEPLELDGLDTHEPEIVVSSMVLPDQSVAVLLTRSIGGLDADKRSDPKTLLASIAVNDAQVTITAGDSTYRLPLVQTGLYQAFGIPLVAGREYHLRVVSKSLGEITASETIPPHVGFDSVYAAVPLWDENEFWRTTVYYSITDPPAHNYYVVNVRSAARQRTIDNILNPDAHTRLLEDAMFNGESFSEIFDAIHRAAPGDSIAISVSNVSADYFNYVKLRTANRLELVEMFSEPFRYPTNIQGGKGYFKMHLTDMRVVVPE